MYTNIFFLLAGYSNSEELSMQKMKCFVIPFEAHRYLLLSISYCPSNMKIVDISNIEVSTEQLFSMLAFSFTFVYMNLVSSGRQC